MAPLIFYFDFVSPYSYLAWTQIGALGQRCGRDVEPVAVLFAGLLEAHGHKGPAEIPAKRRYLFRDLARKAHRLGVAFSWPPAHPFNPLVALRVASLPEEPARREALIDTLFRAAWTRRQAIDSAERVAEVLSAAGHDGAGLVAAAQTPACKQRLRAATDAAIARGVFGVPTVSDGDELFWGTDALPDLEAHLGGELPPFAGGDDLPMAAVRK
jgi:2-hydroxychromene-2-carboxylate isomerase